MLCLLSPFLGTHKRSCVLRGSRTHCAYRRPSGERAVLGRAVRGGVPVTLRFRSDLKPWMDLREAVRLTQATALFNGTFLFLPFLSLRFSDPQALLCHRDAASDTATEPCDQPRSAKSRKYQVKSRRPEQWSEAEHQQPSRQDALLCGYTVLNDTRETLLHEHRLAELLTLFSWGCNLQKKNNKKTQQQKNKTQPFSTIYILFKNKFH